LNSHQTLRPEASGIDRFTTGRIWRATTNRFSRADISPDKTTRQRITGWGIAAWILAAAQLALMAPRSRAAEPLVRPLPKSVDLRGRVHRPGNESDGKLSVFTFLSTQCPISNSYLPKLNELASEFADRGVSFYGVVSDPSVSRSAAQKHREKFGIEFPVLFDASGALRQRLSPTHTPHTIVVDAAGRRVYSGAIDDRYVQLGRKKETATEDYLKSALTNAVAGQTVLVSKTEPIGCLMEQPPNKAHTGNVTFTRDIAPIIQANCVSCHRPGQSGPFALVSYDDVSAHANQVAEVTQSRFMPPWKPSTVYPKFEDEQRLSDQEVELIQAWVRSGKPKGDPADLPPQREYVRGWPLGEPDLVLEMKDAFTVPASGPDIRQYFVLPTGLDENRLVSAIDFHPGTPKAIHHASFFLDTRGAGRKLDAGDPEPGYSGFGGPKFEPEGTLSSWFPGMHARPLPEGMGRLIRPGSDIVVEIHYVSTGKQERDRSKVGIYFADRSARQIVTEVQVGSLELNIPAGKSRHLETAIYTLPVNTTLLDVVPHMHVLGQEMKVFANLPDGKVEPLLWIKDWDFNWQGQYAYAHPVELPKGSRIVVQAWYDNSSGNPLNPNSPPKTVHWGSDADDEMLICHFQCTCESMDDLKRLYNDQQQYKSRAISRHNRQH